MTAERLLYSPGHAAEMLDVSTQTLRGLVAKGELVAIKLGGSTRYAHEDLAALVARLRRAA